MNIVFPLLCTLICIASHSSSSSSSFTLPHKEQYKVVGLEKYGAKDEMYAGFMPIDLVTNNQGSLFFWLVKQRQNDPFERPKKRLIVWLNGGPGCSSMNGMMFDNGPFSIHNAAPSDNAEHDPDADSDGDPSCQPTREPTIAPTLRTAPPTIKPTNEPTTAPSNSPSIRTEAPTKRPAKKTKAPAPSIWNSVGLHEESFMHDTSDLNSNRQNERDLWGKYFPDGLGFKLEVNPYSWNEVADVLYVDQPLGTGFSMYQDGATKIKNEQQVALNFHGFLKSLLKVFPEYAALEEDDSADDDKYYYSDDKSSSFNDDDRFYDGSNKPPNTKVLGGRTSPIYLAGEGYAGIYIPLIAEHIIRYQSDLVYKALNFPKMIKDKTENLINLQGISLGNPTLDFLKQGTSYAEYAYGNGLIPLGVKKLADKLYEKCYALAGGPRKEASMTRGDFAGCGITDLVLEAAGQPDLYDTRSFSKSASEGIFKSEGPFHRFFNTPKIQEILHVRGDNVPGLPSRSAARAVLHTTDSSSSVASSSSSSIDLAASDHLSGETYDTIKSSSNPLQMPPSRTHTADDDKSSPGMGLDSDPIVTAHAYAPAVEWKACSATVDKYFEGDRPISSVSAVQYVLRHLRVQLHSGDNSLANNIIGLMHVLESNEWLEKMWSSASRALWIHGGAIAGEYFLLDYFSLVIVRNSGNFISMSDPSASLDMIRRFLDDQSFQDVQLESEEAFVKRKAREFGFPSKQFLPDLHSSSPDEIIDLIEDKTLEMSPYILLLVLLLLLTPSVLMYLYLTSKLDLGRGRTDSFRSDYSNGSTSSAGSQNWLAYYSNPMFAGVLLSNNKQQYQALSPHEDSEDGLVQAPTSSSSSSSPMCLGGQHCLERTKGLALRLAAALQSFLASAIAVITGSNRSNAPVSNSESGGYQCDPSLGSAADHSVTHDLIHTEKAAARSRIGSAFSNNKSVVPSVGSRSALAAAPAKNLSRTNDSRTSRKPK